MFDHIKSISNIYYLLSKTYKCIVTTINIQQSVHNSYISLLKDMLLYDCVLADLHLLISVVNTHFNIVSAVVNKLKTQNK